MEEFSVRDKWRRSRFPFHFSRSFMPLTQRLSLYTDLVRLPFFFPHSLFCLPVLWTLTNPHCCLPPGYVHYSSAQLARLDPYHFQRKQSYVCDDATFLNGLRNCGDSVAAETMWEDRWRHILRKGKMFRVPPRHTCSFTSKPYLWTMRKWIWVMIGLGGAALFQERSHKPLLCCWRKGMKMGTTPRR